MSLKIGHLNITCTRNRSSVYRTCIYNLSTCTLYIIHTLKVHTKTVLYTYSNFERLRINYK
jgi:hypothetical protein